MLLALQNIQGNQIFNSSEFDNEHFVDAIDKIVLNNFLKGYTTFNLIFCGESNDLVEEILRRMEPQADFVVRIELISKVQNIKGRRKRNNLIFLNSILDFWQLNEKIEPNIFHLRGRFLFILTRGSVEEIEEIFVALWKKNVFNVNVLIEMDNSIEIMTFLPYRGSRCGDTTPITVTRFRNGSFADEDIYLDKFSNLQNCPVKISTYEDPPIVMRNQVENRTVELSGVDMDILSLLSELLHFTPKIKFNQDPQPWGKLYENGSFDGILGEIERNETDMAIGFLFLNPYRTEKASSSVAYFSFPLVFVVSWDNQINYQKLLRPFDRIVWILLLATILIALLVIWMLNVKQKNLRAFVYGSGIRHPATNLLVATIGGSQTKLPKRNFSRFILTMFLIFCLVIRNAYQGALFKFLQSANDEKEIQTLQELVDENFDLYLYQSQVILFANQPNAKYERHRVLW